MKTKKRQLKHFKKSSLDNKQLIHLKGGSCSDEEVSSIVIEDIIEI